MVFSSQDEPNFFILLPHQPIGRFTAFIPAFVHWQSSTANVDSGDAVKESEDIEQPQHHANDHHCIQDGFDRSLHWNVSVDQPKQNTHHHQNDHYL
jgi:hypothetical protein